MQTDVTSRYVTQWPPPPPSRPSPPTSIASVWSHGIHLRNSQDARWEELGILFVGEEFATRVNFYHFSARSGSDKKLNSSIISNQICWTWTVLRTILWGQSVDRKLSISIHLELWELFHSMNMGIIKVIDNVLLWVSQTNQTKFHCIATVIIVSTVTNGNVIKMDIWERQIHGSVFKWKLSVVS